MYIKPNSKKGPLIEVSGEGVLTVFVRERAVDGAANEALIKLLAKHFSVSRSQVRLVRGRTSLYKVVEVNTATS